MGIFSVQHIHTYFFSSIQAFLQLDLSSNQVLLTLHMYKLQKGREEKIKHFLKNYNSLVNLPDYQADSNEIHVHTKFLWMSFLSQRQKS